MLRASISLNHRRLDSRVRGNDAPVVMPVKTGIQASARDLRLILAPMPSRGEIGLRIDQTLTQDATGTLVMLELEAMQLARVKTELSAQYVDHNLLQTDFKNADDHLFLRSDGQGSSREHAALAPRYLGVKAIIATSFARIHWQNLINFGILPLTFTDADDWQRVEQGDVLQLPDVREAIQRGTRVKVFNQTKRQTYSAEHTLTERQVEMILAGSLINLFRKRRHVGAV